MEWTKVISKSCERRVEIRHGKVFFVEVRIINNYLLSLRFTHTT